MSDFNKALEIEKYYVEARGRDEYPFALIDKIKECGFDTLAEYFKEKELYKVRNVGFTFIEQEPITGILECIRLFLLEKPFVLFADSESRFVFHGDGELNSEYCKEHNIPIVPIHAKGGAIVNLPGDFSVVVCSPIDVIYRYDYILRGLKDILQNHTSEKVTVAGNDILIGGKKVCGSTTLTGEKYSMVMAYFSFSDKTELIKNICTTSKVGKPFSYIDCITKEGFKKEVAEWLQVHSF